MTGKIIVNFGSPGETLQRFADSDKKVRVIIGPLGSGKTWQVCQEILKMGASVPPWDNGVRRCKVAAIRNTYKELMSTTVKEWQEKFGAFSKFSAGTIQYPTSTVDVKLDDGTRLAMEIYYISMDGTRSEVEKKFRGLPLTFAWFNETKELPKAGIDMALGRLGRYPPAKACPDAPWAAVGDSNAPAQDHWLYEMAEVRCAPDWGIFKQPGAVNRAGVDESGRVIWKENLKAENKQNLPDNYYSFNMQGKSDDWIAVNLGNEYGTVSDGRPVYSEFNDAIHTGAVRYDPALPLYIGVDFGFTPAAAFMQVSPLGKVSVIDEIVTEDTGITSFAEILKKHVNAKYPGAHVLGFGDPAGSAGERVGERSAFQIINQNSGINFRPASSNVPAIRRDAVAYYMTRMIGGAPAFRVGPECEYLIRGFRGEYCYRRVYVLNQNKYKDTPDKNIYSHVHDALQYACLGAGLGKLVTTGKRVSSNKSYNGLGKGAQKVW